MTSISLLLSPPAACILPCLLVRTCSHLPHASCPPSCSEARELWRPFRECDYRCCVLLRRRSRPPLAIHVPASQTGIDPGEDNEPQFVHSVSVPLCPAASPPAARTLAPSPFSAPAVPAPPTTAALTAAKLASAAALAGSASGASLAPTTAAVQPAGGSRSRPLHRSWQALAAELQALASPAHSSSGSLALSGSGESSAESLSQGSPSPASVLGSQASALPPRPRLALAVARLDCASARWQQAKAQLLAVQAQPQQQQQQQPQQPHSASQGATPGSAGAPGSCCQPPEAWATARVPSVPMLPV